MDKFKIDDPDHLRRAYTYVGVHLAYDALVTNAKRFTSFAGLAFAEAIIRSVLEQERVRLLSSNLGAACKRGFDPSSESLTMETTDAGVFLMAVKHEDLPDGDK